MKKIRSRTCWLMLVGTLSMSFPVFTRSIIHTPEQVEDFFKGFGITLIIGAFIWERFGNKAAGKCSRMPENTNTHV